MDINNLKSCISHEEATIQSYMRDPAFAEYMLQEAINDGDIDEIRKVQRRITEAKHRRESATYWNSLISQAENTAQSGYNLDFVAEQLSKALGIVRAAVLASA